MNTSKQQPEKGLFSNTLKQLGYGTIDESVGMLWCLMMIRGFVVSTMQALC